MLTKLKIGVIALTHSNRRMELERCSRESLKKRYSSKDRLKDIPPFEKLAPINEYKMYNLGVVSFYVVLKDLNNHISFKILGSLKTKKKIQHAIFMDEKNIIIAYESSLELWGINKPIRQYESLKTSDFSIIRVYEHPHFSGLHTVSMLSEKLAVISASASDAILVLDLESGKLVNNIRMPEELYGENYKITESMDLRNHYIHNDLQTTHINSAYPDKIKNSVLVSALIPGVVGCFNLSTKKYHELTSGHIGCHGARVSDEGMIYFSDSTTGRLLSVEGEGHINELYDVESKWLHDALQIENDIYAFSIADRNELRIVDIRKKKVHFNKEFIKLAGSFNRNGSAINKMINKLPFIYGKSTQFLSMYKFT